MIFGTHLLLYSRDPDADRAFFRDVLSFPHVDAGEGWLIFALPPCEMGVHPADQNLGGVHAGNHPTSVTLYLMCGNLHETLMDLEAKGVEHTEIIAAGWGVTTSLQLPGGAYLGLYEPRHAVAVKSPASSF